MLAEETAQPTGATNPPAGQAEVGGRKGLPRFVWDVLGTVLWSYAVIKLFLFDVDVYIVDRLLPQAHWVVNFRFVFLLVILAVWAWKTPRPRFLGRIAYLTFFPLVVVFWKVPRLVYQRRGWVAAFAALDLLTNLARDYRFVLSVSAAVSVAGIVILVGAPSWLYYLVAVILVVLLVVLYARALWRALSPSRFINSQVVLLDKFVDTDLFPTLWAVKDELRGAQVSKFNKAQLNEFTQTMGMGVLVHRLMYWWAFQLDSYRRSPAPFLMSAATFTRLFIQAVAAFALINFALFRADPHAFKYTQAPGVFDFIHYAINVLVAGSVDYLTPTGGLALGAADLAHLTGLLVLITFFATVLLSIRSTRQDEALRHCVGMFRRRGRDFDQRFAQQYEVSVEEAMNRLRELRYGMLGVILFFSSRVPAEFEVEADP